MASMRSREQLANESDVLFIVPRKEVKLINQAPRRQQLSLKSSDLLVIHLAPGGMGAHHGVEDREELAHGRDERDLLGFPRRHEALIEGANHGVSSGSDEGAHGERRAHGGAAAPDEPCAAARAAVAGERRHAGERGDAFPVQPAKFRELAQERATHDGAHPGHRAQEVLLGAPDGTPLDGVVEVTIDRAELPFEPLDVCANTGPPPTPRWRRVRSRPSPPARRVGALWTTQVTCAYTVRDRNSTTG